MYVLAISCFHSIVHLKQLAWGAELTLLLRWSILFLYFIDKSKRKELDITFRWLHVIIFKWKKNEVLSLFTCIFYVLSPRTVHIKLSTLLLWWMRIFRRINFLLWLLVMVLRLHIHQAWWLASLFIVKMLFVWHFCYRRCTKR